MNLRRPSTTTERFAVAPAHVGQLALWPRLTAQKLRLYVASAEWPETF